MKKLPREELTDIIKEFSERGNLKKAMEDIGCSRGTVYLYAKNLAERGILMDRRTLGNNRVYGKKKYVLPDEVE